MRHLEFSDGPPTAESVAVTRDTVQPTSGSLVTLERTPRRLRLDAVVGDLALFVEVVRGERTVEVTAGGHEELLHPWMTCGGRSSQDVVARFFKLVGDAGQGPLARLRRTMRVSFRRWFCARARIVAWGFHPPVRASVAALVTADSSGRVAQLASVCPGLFVVAHGLDDDRRAILDEFWRNAVAGRPLREVAAPVMTAWARRCGASGWKRQFGFVRRADAGTAPWDFDRPMPRGMLVDDVPPDRDGRVHWFATASLLSRLQAERPELAQIGFERFVSRHGAALHAEYHGPGVLSVLEAVASVTKRTRRWPAHPATFAGVMRRILDAPAMPTPNVAVGGELRVCTLGPAGVREEGAGMRHCADGHAEEVERGELMLFAASYGAERLTVSARPQPGGGVALEQIAGPMNMRPSPRAHAAIRAWLAAGASVNEEVTT